TVTITLGEDPSDVLSFTPSGNITGSYANGVLTLTGNDSAAAYQAVLQSVSFSTGSNALIGIRTIEFEVTDATGQTSALPGITALTVVAALNGAPTIVATPVGAVTAGQSTTVSPIVAIVNEPGQNLSGATVTIALGEDPSDVLSFTPLGNISGTYANGVLTLTGDDSAAAYQAVLQSVSFSTGSNALIGIRTIEFEVTDAAGQTSALPGITALTVSAALNTAPTVLTLPAGVATAGQSTTVSPIVTIVNDPGEELSGATVTITLGGDPTDVLSFTPSGNISGTYANGVLTLTGDASAAAYQAVLQSVSFSTGSNGLIGIRTIEFEVTDAANQTSALPGITALTVVAPVNVVPTIVALPVGVVTAGQSTTVSPIVTIVNDPSEELSGATVTIALGGSPSDVLSFTPSGNITGTYANGVLTLMGNASAAAYQTVLQSVSFSTASNTLIGVRTIEFDVTDAAGQTSALPGVTALTVVAVLNAAPTILATPVGGVTAGQSTIVSPVVTIVDDPGQNLSGATVTISLGGDPTDELTFTPSNGITGSYEDGVLTLTGNASAAAYQTVLQSVTFSTGSGALIGVRTIEFKVTDALGATSLLPGLTALTVSGINLPPLVVTSLVGSLLYTAGSPAVTVDPLIAVTDPTSDKLSSVTLAITVGHDTDDVLSYTRPAGNPVTANYNSATGVLTLTGDGTPAQYQEALRAVKFYTPQVLLAGSRTFTVFATDTGGLSSLPLLIALVLLRDIL
ncbi:beta strand repeat-containing protein, partial [Mycobacterium sp. NPDC003323]